MSWHKMTLKVIDVLALMGHRCLGTYHIVIKETTLALSRKVRGKKTTCNFMNVLHGRPVGTNEFR